MVNPRNTCVIVFHIFHNIYKHHKYFAVSHYFTKKIFDLEIFPENILNFFAVDTTAEFPPD